MKKMIFVVIILILVCQLTVVAVLASNQTASNVHLSIRLPAASRSDTLTLIYYEEVLSESMAAQQQRKVYHANADTNTGEYQFDFRCSKKAGYISVFKERTGLINSVVYLLDLYIVEPGDSVSIVFDKTNRKAEDFSFRKSDPYYNSILFYANLDAHFEGKGAVKFRCRREADAITAIDATSLMVYDSSGNYILQNGYAMALEQSLAIVEKYKQHMSDYAGNLMAADFTGRYNLHILHDLFIAWKDAASQEAKSFLQQRIFAADLYPYTPDSVLQSKSYCWFITCMLSYQVVMEGKRLKDTYWQIKEKYKGLVREKMMTGFLSRRYKDLTSAEVLISDALLTCKQPYYINIIKSLDGTIAKGSPAFDFSLENDRGEIVRLSDFKGKVVMLDFYYTGCGACMAYYEYGLHPAKINFKAVEEVVFVAISVDQDRDLWLKGIAGGKYTSPSAINLYTGGKGADHPIIEHYKVTGFPRPLLIDKAGKIFSTSDLDLRQSGSKQLIDTINKALQSP